MGLPSPLAVGHPHLTDYTTDPPSLRSLAARTSLVLNCKFRLYGEPVVSACADSICDYLDTCGRSMERMMCCSLAAWVGWADRRLWQVILVAR
ncbi:hypothetical protein Acr_13g0007100 [Actinidia rufa]|uniref:Uncharacterized protein n=1 Tax=Actinidia rufa TaxID=165716 RepID=A0A7J0FMB6_9ERIC|nr:hypothetical protein Acr_13g0007100 [Actinidia rufa]